MPRVRILLKFCKGCGLCVEACPKGCLELSSALSESGVTPAVVKDDSKCTSCGNCAVICPDAAVEILDRLAKK